MVTRSIPAASVVLLIAGCASAPADPNRPRQPACDQSLSCFYERDIRSFQVLDDRTVVVLVGRNQCPFKVELDGFVCDLNFASFLSFNDPDGRICSWDRSFVIGGPFPRQDEYCRVRQVTPMTDDELLEAYATKGLTPPLPAKGSGEIEVVEEPPQETAPSAEQGGRAAPEAAEGPQAPASGDESGLP